MSRSNEEYLAAVDWRMFECTECGEVEEIADSGGEEICGCCGCLMKRMEEEP